VLRLLGESQFLADNCVVAAEIGEMASSADGGFCQAEVQTVGNGRECAVVTFHEASSVLLFGGVEPYGPDFLFVGDAVDAGSDIFRALEVAVSESDGIDVALAGHIVGRG